MQGENLSVKDRIIYIRQRIPPVGLRMVKSAVAVFLCFLVHLALGGKRDMMQSIIAAAICIQSRMDYSARTGFERIAGTLIGAAFGCILATIEQIFPQIDLFHELPKFILISLTVIPVIYTTVLMKLNNSAILACVVLFAVSLGPVGGSPIIYALNRVIDTMIGILIAIGVNLFEFPHYHNNDILFISGVDDTLLDMKDSLSPYSKIELNRMISQGAKFTVSTKRTPASLVEVLHDIDLNLPVIAMDGAVLYDVRENLYLKVYVMSANLIRKVLDFCDAEEVHCFINTLHGDLPVIYCPKKMTGIEKREYELYRKSPYRHYVRQKFPSTYEATYIYAVLRSDRAEEVRTALKKQDFACKLKIKVEHSKDFPGSAYLKLYSRNATKSNMIEYLNQYVGAKKTVTFGGPEGKYSVIIHDGDTNKVVRTMKKLYRPIGLRPGSIGKRRINKKNIMDKK